MLIFLIRNWDTLLCDTECGKPAKEGQGIVPIGEKGRGQGRGSRLFYQASGRNGLSRNSGTVPSRLKDRDERRAERRGRQSPGQGSEKSTCFELVTWARVPACCPAGPRDTFPQREMMVPTIQGPSDELTKCREDKQTAQNLALAGCPQLSLPPPPALGATKRQGLLVTPFHEAPVIIKCHDNF